MYSHRRYTISVRDPEGRYGNGLPSPDHPGAAALDDLSDAPAPEIPLILARYVALRAWVLAAHAVGGPVAVHALSAAREHLSTTAPGWSEGRLLGGSLEDAGTGRSLELLEEAAAAASSLGHHHGARALRASVREARLRRGPFPPPSGS